ncbi:hypothetical protein RRG08_036428 [Elysia crispata]|uniref:Uncharacterized protein n=1 Tax=Elysia crispata TaxID=231223 RepID=A0AAE0ZKJ0_9GAST|nr:hypothetical protein RRG08_036428 [Elysia crispata]
MTSSWPWCGLEGTASNRQPLQQLIQVDNSIFPAIRSCYTGKKKSVSKEAPRQRTLVTLSTSSALNGNDPQVIFALDMGT